MGGEAPWYRSWFGQEYLRLYPHRDEEEAERAVELLVNCVRLPPGARVLDLACGAGRHLRALAERPTLPVGLDLSFPLLLAARESDPRIPLVRGDMRGLPFRSDAFAAVTSFFTSFGYFPDDADDRSVLREIRRVLEPGGHLLLDFLNADRVRETLRPRDETEVDGRLIIQERRLKEEGKVVEKTIRIGGKGAEEPLTFRERVRLYSAEELEALLVGEGLAPIRRFGDYQGGPFREAAQRVILLARTP